MSTIRVLAAVAVLAGSACRSEGGAAATSDPPASDPPAADPPAAKMTISSSAFAADADIPPKYTCVGEGLSPPLSWSDAPEGTKSFALVVDDPDAPDPAKPERTWVHWVVSDIPAGTTELPENVGDALPEGAHAGMNDWDKTEWGSPCPPIGRHHYVFKIYALDTTLGLKAPTKAELESAMKGHVLAKGQLIGLAEKSSP